VPEELLAEARELARTQGCTLETVLEASLREVINRRRFGRFTLRDASVPGAGLTAEFACASEAQIRAAGYEAV
jgi:hypothetical protein